MVDTQQLEGGFLRDLRAVLLGLDILSSLTSHTANRLASQCICPGWLVSTMTMVLGWELLDGN